METNKVMRFKGNKKEISLNYTETLLSIDVGRRGVESVVKEYGGGWGELKRKEQDGKMVLSEALPVAGSR